MYIILFIPGVYSTLSCRKNIHYNNGLWKSIISSLHRRWEKAAKRPPPDVGRGLSLHIQCIISPCPWSHLHPCIFLAYNKLVFSFAHLCERSESRGVVECQCFLWVHVCLFSYFVFVFNKTGLSMRICVFQKLNQQAHWNTIDCSTSGLKGSILVQIACLPFTAMWPWASQETSPQSIFLWCKRGTVISTTDITVLG